MGVVVSGGVSVCGVVGLQTGSNLALRCHRKTASETMLPAANGDRLTPVNTLVTVGNEQEEVLLVVLLQAHNATT